MGALRRTANVPTSPSLEDGDKETPGWCPSGIQIFLTEEQRRRLDRLADQEGKSLAQLIREAVDAYLARHPDPQAALEETFGRLPHLEVPSRDEWDRG